MTRLVLPVCLLLSLASCRLTTSPTPPSVLDGDSSSAFSVVDQSQEVSVRVRARDATELSQLRREDVLATRAFVGSALASLPSDQDVAAWLVDALEVEYPDESRVTSAPFHYRWEFDFETGEWELVCLSSVKVILSLASIVVVEIDTQVVLE